MLDSSDEVLGHVYRRSAADLGALRIPSPDGTDRVVIAAALDRIANVEIDQIHRALADGA